MSNGVYRESREWWRANIKKDNGSTFSRNKKYVNSGIQEAQ